MISVHIVRIHTSNVCSVERMTGKNVWINKINPILRICNDQSNESYWIFKQKTPGLNFGSHLRQGFILKLVIIEAYIGLFMPKQARCIISIFFHVKNLLMSSEECGSWSDDALCALGSGATLVVKPIGISVSWRWRVKNIILMTADVLNRTLYSLLFSSHNAIVFALLKTIWRYKQHLELFSSTFLLFQRSVLMY